MSFLLLLASRECVLARLLVAQHAACSMQAGGSGPRAVLTSHHPDHHHRQQHKSHEMALLRTVLPTLVLALVRFGPTAAAPPPAAGGANLGEAGISELWRVVNGLGQTVQILQGEVQRLTSEREKLLGRVHAVEETNTQQGGQLAELRRTVEGMHEDQRGRTQTERHDEEPEHARRLQSAPPSGERTVHIIQRNASFHGAGLQWGTSVASPTPPPLPSSGGGHRRAQQACGNFNTRANAVNVRCCDEPTEDCSSGRPATCNAGCAALFLPFWADCSSHLGAGASAFLGVVAQCQAAASATANTGGGSTTGNGALVHEFNLVCPGDAVSGCVPTCDASLHGDLLLLNVDGDDSKYSCEMSHGKYSWVGPASDGGYFGEDMLSFLAAVITHAPGVFMCSMGASVAVSTSVDLVVGQHATLQGTASGNLTAPVWRYSGDEAAFVLQAGAALKIGGVAVASSSGLAFRISAGATITTSALQLLSAGVSSAIQCAVLASGIGRQGLACDTAVGLPGVLRISGPLIITTSGLGFGTGSTQYIGENYEQFRVAVSRTSGSLAGFYTLQLKQDTVVSAVGLIIQSTMHVSIIGDDSRPAWQFPGSGSTFTVQNAGFLNLRHITLSAPRVIAGAAPILVVNLGGQATIDTSTLTNVGITAHGTLRLASSQLTDVQLLSDHGASVSLDTVTVIGTSQALVLPVSCTMTVSGSQLNNVWLQVDATGRLTLSHTVFRIVGVVATVATGGSLTVSSSQLVHGSATDPFPCDGHDMHCTGPHAQAVTLSGPASINTNAPLICPPGGGDCLYGYVDMVSCLADIATGMSSCFVYLQHDSPAMRTLSVSAGQYFEVHGQASGAAAQLALHADWSVAGSGSLLLGSLQLGGGSGSGGTHLTVATGGRLTLQTVTMASGTVTFSGSVTVTGSTLSSARLSGTSGQLSLTGGTLTGSTVQLARGTATFGGSCMLINTPVTVSGAAGAPQALLGISQCELRGDGTAVPLTVGAAAMATVTQTTFRSTAANITAVSVAAGGNLTVGSSQLVRADGHSDPFPCDGTLPRCAGPHAGPVKVDGPAAITLASLLVCDTTTGTCLSDLCFVVDCGTTQCVSPNGYCFWDSGTETATRRPAGGAFTLFKLKPRYIYVRTDPVAGSSIYRVVGSTSVLSRQQTAVDYSAVCLSHGMVGIGGGTNPYPAFCDSIDQFGGMCMPNSWSNIGHVLDRKTGAGSVGAGWFNTVVFSWNGMVQPYYGPNFNGFAGANVEDWILSPVCARAH
eukprot:SAG25_NODE_10_length_28450_cov_12.738775_2_plen_1259_part_00